MLNGSIKTLDKFSNISREHFFSDPRLNVMLREDKFNILIWQRRTSKHLKGIETNIL